MENQVNQVSGRHVRALLTRVSEVLGLNFAVFNPLATDNIHRGIFPCNWEMGWRKMKFSHCRKDPIIEDARLKLEARP